MSTAQWPSSKLQPARLSFLAIYSPSLGPTDDTFPEQVVYYYSRVADEARKKKHGRSDDAVREEENEKLRQIGLAQGMVDFARSFSDGAPVDSVETEQSRIVLQELEKGWWILASIDLTRLPAYPAATSTIATKPVGMTEKQPGVEFSSREVSPPALLVQQMLQAHYIFSLHHGPSLHDLYIRLPRDKFCNTLDRFWTRFSRNWDVLFHGNPAVDIFSGLKLSSGGELGFGVGEEDWGSSERNVLEDLTHRTEGLVDLVVSRFGGPASSNKPSADDSDALPWMGSGAQVVASDGIIFGGVGGIARPSLRNVNLWLQQIYTFGDHAYGVRDNPQRERRKRRRRNATPANISNGSARHAPQMSKDLSATNLRQKAQDQSAAKQTEDPISPSRLPKDDGPQIYDRIASYDHAIDHPQLEATSHPGVPLPIASAAKHALNSAAAKAIAKAQPSGKTGASDQPEAEGTTMGIPDQYMKYMTFGLSTFMKPSAKPMRPKLPSQSSTTSSMTLRPADSHDGSKTSKLNHDDDITEGEDDADDTSLALNNIDPMPEGETLAHRTAMQKRQEKQGHFVIGLKGDLNAIPAEVEGEADLTDGSLFDDAGGSRVVLRTLQVEIIPEPSIGSDDDDSDGPFQARRQSTTSLQPHDEAPNNFRRLRILVYAHRPFLYCFLFEQRTDALNLTSFYKTLHQNLIPIHKPLLKSTNVAKVEQRIMASHELEAVDNSDPASRTEKAPIYDLVYDPRSLTVHTSIPNIPEPGTMAAEGMSSSGTTAPWTRIDALNVHSQILNTLASTKHNKGELERTSKTSRGWWVVWMRVPPFRPSSATHRADRRASTDTATPSTSTSAPSASTPPTGASHNSQLPFDPDNPSLSDLPDALRKRENLSRIAFLVRQASDAGTTSKASSGSATSRAVSGILGLGYGSAKEGRSGSVGAGWGPPALGGSGLGGIGVDARRYVEGLLSLNR